MGKKSDIERELRRYGNWDGRMYKEKGRIIDHFT